MSVSGWVRFGIAVGALGVMLTLIGLFPTITGIDPSPGFGIVQTVTVLAGLTTLVIGALVFVQTAYYPRQPHTLAQEIAVRLSLTGLLIMIASGLADVLGYGSNPPGPESRPTLGPYQTAGLIGGFLIAALGVLIFALTGPHTPPPPSPDDETHPHSGI
ncbi:MAG: hypothetical protein ACYDBJ_04745 [Aggregatilineales bacterium]